MIKSSVIEVMRWGITIRINVYEKVLFRRFVRLSWHSWWWKGEIIARHLDVTSGYPTFGHQWIHVSFEIRLTLKLS